MVYTLHKICNYFLNKNIIFYVDHMTLTYFVNKPQLFGRITRWLFLFLEHDFIITYKSAHSHYVANALSPSQHKATRGT
jgi:hypothetical protein